MGFSPANAQTSLQPSTLFTDGAVLQRDRTVPIWGTAPAGEEVEIKFRSQVITAKTDAQGKWTAELHPETAGGPDDLIISSGTDSIKLQNILVGEVWIASGQSNMEFKLSRSQPPLREIPGDANFRVFNVRTNPSDDPVATLQGAWQPPTPGVSAVAYYFGLQLRKKLGVPVGIVVSAVAGTPISSWISPDGATAAPPAKSSFEEAWKQVLASHPEKLSAYEKTLADWQDKKKQAEIAGVAFSEPGPREPMGPDSPKRPYCLFNGMIHPLVPYAIRGALWYQGESDAGGRTAPFYSSMLRALIADWRKRWNDPQLPILIIQLPTYQQDEDWVIIREAQQVVARDPGNALVVTLDVGEEKDVHPAHKEPVGTRAGYLALADVYGLKMPARSPVVKSVQKEGSALVITFQCDDNANLVYQTGKNPSGLEIAGADGTFFPATARIEGNKLLVASPNVADPSKVRYAWSAWTPVTIFDSNGLPASQFSLSATP